MFTTKYIQPQVVNYNLLNYCIKYQVCSLAPFIIGNKNVIVTQGINRSIVETNTVEVRDNVQQNLFDKPNYSGSKIYPVLPAPAFHAYRQLIPGGAYFSFPSPATTFR